MRCVFCMLIGFVLVIDAIGAMSLSSSSLFSAGARIGRSRGAKAAGGGGGCGVGRCACVGMLGMLVGNCSGMGLSHGNECKGTGRAVNPSVLFCVT